MFDSFYLWFICMLGWKGWRAKEKALHLLWRDERPETSAVPLLFIPKGNTLFQIHFPISCRGNGRLADCAYCDVFSESLRGQFKHSSVICSHRPQTLWKPPKVLLLLILVFVCLYLNEYNLSTKMFFCQYIIFDFFKKFLETENGISTVRKEKGML